MKRSSLTILTVAAAALTACDRSMTGPQPYARFETRLIDDIEITPASVSLEPGARIQFGASVRSRAGTMMDSARIEWRAARGSIDTTGLYVAPVGEGEDWVVVSNRSGSVADSAAVLVEIPAADTMSTDPASR